MHTASPMLFSRIAATLVGITVSVIALEAGAEPPASEPSAKAPRGSGATLGEGGRDLVPRLRWVADNDLHPFFALELHCAVGAKVQLLGPDAAYMRINPVLAVGLSPSRVVTIYGGVGPGASAIGPSSDRTAAVERDVAATGAIVVGARYTGAALPMVLEWRTDTVLGYGSAATLAWTIEVTD